MFFFCDNLSNKLELNELRMYLQLSMGRLSEFYAENEDSFNAEITLSGFVF